MRTTDPELQGRRGRKVLRSLSLFSRRSPARWKWIAILVASGGSDAHDGEGGGRGGRDEWGKKSQEHRSLTAGGAKGTREAEGRWEILRQIAKCECCKKLNNAGKWNASKLGQGHEINGRQS